MGDFHKGNQVEIARTGTVSPTKWAHIAHLKPLLRADDVIDKLPDYNAFTRKAKLACNPDKLPDLGWDRPDTLNVPKSQPKLKSSNSI